MHKYLVEICQEFETIENFLTKPNEKNNELVNSLFSDFMECFPLIKKKN